MITPNILFPNWRERTCGECAWWRAVGICRRYGVWCLHHGLSSVDGKDPACPAFVAREEAQPHKCAWRQDEYTGAYHTECGHLWEFTEGGLVDNDPAYPLDGYYVLTQDIDASATREEDK